MRLCTLTIDAWGMPRKSRKVTSPEIKVPKCNHRSFCRGRWPPAQQMLSVSCGVRCLNESQLRKVSVLNTHIHTLPSQSRHSGSRGVLWGSFGGPSGPPEDRPGSTPLATADLQSRFHSDTSRPRCPPTCPHGQSRGSSVQSHHGPCPGSWQLRGPQICLSFSE